MHRTMRYSKLIEIEARNRERCLSVALLNWKKFKYGVINKQKKINLLMAFSCFSIFLRINEWTKCAYE